MTQFVMISIVPAIMADLIFAIGSIVFILALIPSVRGEAKPDLKTSLTTGSVLAVFAITYFTISFWFAGITTLITAAMWFALAFQKWVNTSLDEAFVSWDLHTKVKAQQQAKRRTVAHLISHGQDVPPDLLAEVTRDT